MTGLDEREGGSGDRSALSRCIGIPSDRFAQDHWGRSALLTRGADPDGFADLFSTGAVDELVSRRGIRTPFLRMAKEGTVLPPSSYTGPGGLGAEIADQASADHVLEQFAGGATIVLQGLHRLWPPIGDFAGRLADELGHPAQVNAYVTPASNRGFDPHYDVHDVFVLQIAGRKRWVIHEPVHPEPLSDEPWSLHAAAVAARAGEPALIDAVLEPGDALYLPRGFIHSATALGGTTVHLTIGVPAFSGTDIARELLDRAVRSPSVRRSLRLGVDVGDPDDVADAVRATTRALIAELEADADSAPDRVAHSLGSRRARLTPPEPLQPLGTIQAMDELDASTRVRCRRGLAPRIVDEGDRVAVGLADRTIRLPAVAGDAVRALVAAPRAVGELPGLDLDDARVVVRRLLREGVLVAE